MCDSSDFVKDGTTTGSAKARTIPVYLQETKLAEIQKSAKIKSEKTRVLITRSETLEKQNNENYTKFTNIKCQLHKISTRNTKHGISSESKSRKKWKLQKRTENISTFDIKYVYGKLEKNGDFKKECVFALARAK